MSNIGILAYGSLIEDPGQELLPLIEKRIHTKTPFAVEFARLSRKRGNGPTLVPFEHGANVNAQILLLQAGATIEQAIDMLYRRETGNFNAHYMRPAEAAITVNTVLIDRLTDFEQVQTVLYTRIGSNIPHLNPEILAQSAIASARSQAGADRADGINYLISVKRMGIKTNLSPDYENTILQLTNTSNLEEAYQHCRAVIQ